MEPPNSHRSRPDHRGRLAVVSGYALKPLTPRGQRTQQLIESLERNWEVELISLPESNFGEPDGPLGERPLWRRAASSVVHDTLLDRWEPWSLRRLGRWKPDVDAALLIAYPWSPVTYAARSLRKAGIPYVVDAGDPWALTTPAKNAWRFLAALRTRRAERSIWDGAAGAIVTTGQQANVIARLFPDLQILVRPNGYDPVPNNGQVVERSPDGDRGRLRLVHYGSLSSHRADVTRLLSTLARSKRWDSIAFTQFGVDRAGMLDRAPAGVEIERRSMRPWSEVMATAPDYDLAIVVGNWLSGQLPSKAIQYMTLPIPRLAVVEQEAGDALAEYVGGRPGWATVEVADPQADHVVWKQLAHGWSPAELAPPSTEAWPAVAAQAVGFIERRIAEATGEVAEPRAQGRLAPMESGG